MPSQIIDSPANWRGPDIKARQDWIQILSANEITDIEANVQALHDQGLGIADIDKRTFPLKTLQPAFAKALDYLENGPGMFHFRGLPALKLSKEDRKSTRLNSSHT